jgi:hypothetical protein
MTDLSTIFGIGEVTKNAYHNQGITTVEELAAKEAGEIIGIPGVAKHIGQAKIKMIAAGKTIATLESPKITLGALTATAPVHAPVNASESKTNPVTKEEKSIDHETLPEQDHRHLIQDHSWWEMRVMIPRTLSDDELREAVVYEMCVDPFARVSMLCSWITSNDKNERMCSMTYSPQFLYYFNCDLPQLTVSMLETDLNKLPNQQVVKNVLWEVNTMYHLNHDQSDDN